MALKALEIYKLLPKSNCKECGFPTCMAFAMKIAAGKVDVEQCPCLDEETKALIGGATRPPIQLVTVGVGARSVSVGEEVVMFRHEKTFYHQPGLFFRISDAWPEERVREIAERVTSEVFPRIGQDLQIDGIAFCYESGSPENFGKTVELVESCSSLPEVIMADDPAAHESALGHCGQFQPLLHAATPDNYQEMCGLAVRYGCPLALRGSDISTLSDLAKACRDEGVTHLMLDPAPATLQEFISVSTSIREQAITRASPDLGHPVVLNTLPVGMPDPAVALGILRYASIIISDALPMPSTRAALTLRQNIYTDPQKPIQVTPGIYPINDPGDDAPVLLTVNFSLTYFTLLGYLEASQIPCYLFIVDTEGMSVLTAVAGGKLTEDLVRESIKKCDLESLVKHRKIIIPGYASPLSGKIEDATGWRVLVGPRDAAEIEEFLEKEWK